MSDERDDAAKLLRAVAIEIAEILADDIARQHHALEMEEFKKRASDVGGGNAGKRPKKSPTKD